MNTTTNTITTTTTTTDYEFGFDLNGDFTRLWRDVEQNLGYAPDTFTSPHRFRAIPHHGTPEDSDPFFTQYGIRLPRGLREEAAGMSWHDFQNRYAPNPTWRITHIDTERLRGARMRFTIDLTRSHEGGRNKSTHEFIGTGPIQAMTQILADLGRSVEIISFHQHAIYEATATFLQVKHNKKTCWVMGFGPSRDLSSAHALSAACHMLHEK